MADRFSWLHFSDLHVGQSHGWLWPRMRKMLFDDLQAVVEESGGWDLVFFTGDFAQSGTLEQFDSTAKELELLWNHFKTLGTRPLLVPIPSNHDLTRPAETHPIARQSFRWHDPKEDKVRQEFWDNAGSPVRECVEGAFTRYSEFISRLQIPTPEFTTGLLPGDLSTAITLENGLRIGIIGLNSSYLQLSAGSYKGLLDMHVRQLHQLCDGDPDTWCSRHDVALLLTHHPHDWLHPDARDHFNSEIYPPGRFHANLCGHMHEPRMQEISEGGSIARSFRQGPSLFGLETWGDSGTERVMGYTASRLEFSASDIEERLWPRRDHKSYAGSHKITPDFGYDLDQKTGCIVRHFERQPHFSPDPDAKFVADESETGQTRLSDEQPSDGDEAVISLDRSVDVDTALRHLKAVPRLSIRSEPHHRAVRREEQARFEALLHRQRFAWLICDWGLGKESFLAAGLEKLLEKKDLPNIFRIQCGGSDTTAALLAAAEKEIGLPFQKFCTLCAPLEDAVLIFDDLSSAFLSGSENTALLALKQTVLDFCPAIFLVLIARRPPSGVDQAGFVDLHPLDEPELKTYILHHPKSRGLATESNAVDRIHAWTSGLPLRVDQLLDGLQLSALNDILSEPPEATGAQLQTTEPVPLGLVRTVAGLASAEDGFSRETFRLLKVLCVLQEGETFKSLKRLFPNAPFQLESANELARLSLIESIPIAQSAGDLGLPAATSVLHGMVAPKLLRALKQVRDYVNTLISPTERSDIIHAATGPLFGRKWRDGKVRLRIELPEGTAISQAGPGNEYEVVKYLLNEASHKTEQWPMKRALRLGLTYCRALLDSDRFRDATVVGEMLLHYTTGSEHAEDYVESARIYAWALRMSGRGDEALSHLSAALEQGGAFLSNEMKAFIHLEFALLYERKGARTEALAASDKVLELVHKDSPKGVQARCVRIEVTETGSEKLKHLTSLEQLARSKDFTTVANNIAITVSKLESNPTKAMDFRDRVIGSQGDLYNRVRAVLDKANRLKRDNAIDTLSTKERQLLSRAFSLTYTQRMGGLFDSCRSVLWSLFQKEGFLASILRLFRFSSFLFRLKGTEEKEVEMLGVLRKMDFDQIRQKEGDNLRYELQYLEWRQRDNPAPEKPENE